MFEGLQTGLSTLRTIARRNGLTPPDAAGNDYATIAPVTRNAARDRDAESIDSRAETIAEPPPSPARTGDHGDKEKDDPDKRSAEQQQQDAASSAPAGAIEHDPSKAGVYRHVAIPHDMVADAVLRLQSRIDVLKHLAKHPSSDEELLAALRQLPSWKEKKGSPERSHEENIKKLARSYKFRQFKLRHGGYEWELKPGEEPPTRKVDDSRPFSDKIDSVREVKRGGEFRRYRKLSMERIGIKLDITGEHDPVDLIVKHLGAPDMKRANLRGDEATAIQTVEIVAHADDMLGRRGDTLRVEKERERSSRPGRLRKKDGRASLDDRHDRDRSRSHGR